MMHGSVLLGRKEALHRFISKVDIAAKLECNISFKGKILCCPAEEALLIGGKRLVLVYQLILFDFVLVLCISILRNCIVK